MRKSCLGAINGNCCERWVLGDTNAGSLGFDLNQFFFPLNIEDPGGLFYFFLSTSVIPLGHGNRLTVYFLRLDLGFSVFIFGGRILGYTGPPSSAESYIQELRIKNGSRA